MHCVRQSYKLHKLRLGLANKMKFLRYPLKFLIFFYLFSYNNKNQVHDTTNTGNML